MKQILIAGMMPLTLLFFTGCSDKAKEPEPIIRPVRYQKIEPAAGNRLRTFAGVSKAETETNMSFQVGGTILSIDVQVGQRVKKGDRIAELDTTDIALKLEDARASVENARVQQENARANLNRIRELYENNNIALSDYEAAKNQYASAKATYESKQKQLDLQQRQLSYGVLTSPVAGNVAEVPVEINENVQPGQLVASIISDSNIEVEVGIPGNFVHRIKTGSKATANFGRNTQSYSGVVSKVSRVSSAASTYPVFVRLDEVAETIRPGMPAEVSFAFDDDGGGKKIFVPAGAVAEDNAERFVYVLEMGPEAGFATVHRNPVTVGELTGAGLEIRDGLAEGQYIVTSGISTITDQMKVRVSQ